jgi:hypothetical protein
MTLSQLGKSTKSLHPGAYDSIPDTELGRAVARKFPDFYGHIQEPDEMDAGIPSDSDLDSNTVPETPRTLAIQLEQLASGLRRVVFIARGSKVRINPADYGARKLPLPAGEFIYDPKAIKPREIISAVANHELAEILGAAQGGYGAPSKDNLDLPVSAVVARDSDGETIHSALTDTRHIKNAVDAASRLTPADGTISSERPEIELAHRLDGISSQAEPLPDRRPKAGARWPKPAGSMRSSVV